MAVFEENNNLWTTCFSNVLTWTASISNKPTATEGGDRINQEHFLISSSRPPKIKAHKYWKRSSKNIYQSVKLCDADFIWVHHAELSPGDQVQAQLSVRQRCEQEVHKIRNIHCFFVFVFFYNGMIYISGTQRLCTVPRSASDRSICAIYFRVVNGLLRKGIFSK